MEYTLAGLRSQNQDVFRAVRRPETALLVSFFSNGKMSVIQHCYIFRDGEKGTVRFVRNWAIQTGGAQSPQPGVSMPQARRTTLDNAIRQLPSDQPFAQDEDTFLVGWDDNGKWRTRVYDRSWLPPEVLALCELVGIPPTWL